MARPQGTLKVPGSPTPGYARGPKRPALGQLEANSSAKQTKATLSAPTMTRSKRLFKQSSVSHLRSKSHSPLVRFVIDKSSPQRSDPVQPRTSAGQQSASTTSAPNASASRSRSRLDRPYDRTPSTSSRSPSRSTLSLRSVLETMNPDWFVSSMAAPLSETEDEADEHELFSAPSTSTSHQSTGEGWIWTPPLLAHTTFLPPRRYRTTHGRLRIHASRSAVLELSLPVSAGGNDRERISLRISPDGASSVLLAGPPALAERAYRHAARWMEALRSKTELAVVAWPRRSAGTDADTDEEDEGGLPSARRACTAWCTIMANGPAPDVLLRSESVHCGPATSRRYKTTQTLRLCVSKHIIVLERRFVPHLLSDSAGEWVRKLLPLVHVDTEGVDVLCLDEESALVRRLDEHERDDVRSLLDAGVMGQDLWARCLAETQEEAHGSEGNELSDADRPVSEKSEAPDPAPRSPPFNIPPQRTRHPTSPETPHLSTSRQHKLRSLEEKWRESRHERAAVR